MDIQFEDVHFHTEGLLQFCDGKLNSAKKAMMKRCLSDPIVLCLF